MSAQPRTAHGSGCGLRVLRDVVRPDARRGGGSHAASAGCGVAGESSSLRVLCVDCAAVVLESLD